MKVDFLLLLIGVILLNLLRDCPVGFRRGYEVETSVQESSAPTTMPPPQSFALWYPFSSCCANVMPLKYLIGFLVTKSRKFNLKMPKNDHKWIFIPLAS